MSDEQKPGGNMGPQGTQVFEVNDVNKMIAEEIASSQSPDADTPALIGISESMLGQQFVFDKDKMEIGRRPNSDIVLNDSSVSSMHAQIIREGDYWKVLNLLSSNGTFVNGEKVSERLLSPGDRIAFAGTEFVFTYIDDVQPKESQPKGMGLVTAAIALVIAFAAILYFIL